MVDKLWAEYHDTTPWLHCLDTIVHTLTLKYPHLCKTAALLSCTVGGRGDVPTVFMYANGLNQIHGSQSKSYWDIYSKTMRRNLLLEQEENSGNHLSHYNSSPGQYVFCAVQQLFRHFAKEKLWAVGCKKGGVCHQSQWDSSLWIIVVFDVWFSIEVVEPCHQLVSKYVGIF